MIVDPITELGIVGVYDRGIANQERIVLYANETVNMGKYGVMIGVRAVNRTAFPIRDNLLWFGDGVVSKGDWIFIYTGPGTPRQTTLPNSEERLITVHWGQKETILGNKELLPILFRVDAVLVAEDSEHMLERPA